MGYINVTPKDLSSLIIIYNETLTYIDSTRTSIKALSIKKTSMLYTIIPTMGNSIFIIDQKTSHVYFQKVKFKRLNIWLQQKIIYITHFIF